MIIVRKACGATAATFLALALTLAGCAERMGHNTDMVLAGATAAVDRFTGAMNANDEKVVDEMLGNDARMVAFGTDEAERWVGSDTVKDAFHAQMKSFQTTSLKVRDQVVRITPAGDGAYFSEVWNWKINSGGKAMELKNLRITGVLVREDGAWRVAQFHVSLPVGGQAVAPRQIPDVTCNSGPSGDETKPLKICSWDGSNFGVKTTAAWAQCSESQKILKEFQMSEVGLSVVPGRTALR